MATMENFIYSMSRFVFGLGVGIALTSVYVIVTSNADVFATKAAADDVVQLDPIVVTISAERFDAIRAEAEPAAKTVHLYGAGPRPV